MTSTKLPENELTDDKIADLLIGNLGSMDQPDHEGIVCDGELLTPNEMVAHLKERTRIGLGLIIMYRKEMEDSLDPEKV